MICCKIITDYQQQCLHFADILNDLNKIGDVLWDNHYFYFANTCDKKITAKNIQRIFKKNGCANIFVEEYNKDFQPQEKNHVSWWIEDKLIKIGYVEFENEEQEKIKFISQQLTELDKLLIELKKSQLKTEDDKN